MFYATHRLHLPQREPLRLHVVEVVDGVVRSFFPFDGERESMLWVDELYASHNRQASFLSDIKDEPSQAAAPLYLYSVDNSTLADAALVLLN